MTPEQKFLEKVKRCDNGKYHEQYQDLVDRALKGSRAAYYKLHKQFNS